MIYQKTKARVNSLENNDYQAPESTGTIKRESDVKNKHTQHVFKGKTQRGTQTIETTGAEQLTDTPISRENEGNYLLV